MKRILHLCKSGDGESIFASCINGIIYKLDLNLNIMKESQPFFLCWNANVIVCDEKYLFSRDSSGNLIQYDKSSLEIIKFLSGSSIQTDKKDCEPIPSISNGLAIYHDELVILNAYGELIVLDKFNLKIKRKIEIEIDNGYFIESINTSLQKNQILSDTVGNIYTGSFESSHFKFKKRIDFGNIHKTIYDKKFNRFMMTTDASFGIAISDIDIENVKYIKMTNDDVEWIDFSEDYNYFYVACFDHYLHVFRNEETPQLVKKIGPFKFQLRQVANIKNNAYVLLESGEIYKVNIETNEIINSSFGTNCAWDMTIEKNKIYLPMESGDMNVFDIIDHKNDLVIEKNSIISVNNNVRMRRMLKLNENDFLGIFTSGEVIKFNKNGDHLWNTRLSGICRDICFMNERDIVVATEAGEICVISSEDGKIIKKQMIDYPIWSLASKNNMVYFATRTCIMNDDIPKNIIGSYDYNLNKISILKNNGRGNIKRIKFIDDYSLMLCGNGNYSLCQFDLKTSEICQTYDSWLLNTCEDFVEINSYIYAITYGYQLNTYHKNGELLDSQFPHPNYPKSIKNFKSSDGTNFLIVCGRNPYISIFEIVDHLPVLKSVQYF